MNLQKFHWSDAAKQKMTFVLHSLYPKATANIAYFKHCDQSVRVTLRGTFFQLYL